MGDVASGNGAVQRVVGEPAEGARERGGVWSEALEGGRVEGSYGLRMEGQVWSTTMVAGDVLHPRGFHAKVGDETRCAASLLVA